MKLHSKILPWENNRRLRRLEEFRGLLIEYFNNVRPGYLGDEPMEEPAAQVARTKMNRILDDVHDIIWSAGLATMMRVTPPPMMGGYVQSVDVVHNIFLLHRFQITPNTVLDFIDRALGVYEANAKAAAIRLINPFFYIGWLLDVIARLPFILLGRAGFNARKVEDSLIGRIVKGAIYLVTSLGTLLGVLERLDYLDPVKEALHRYTTPQTQPPPPPPTVDKGSAPTAAPAPVKNEPSSSPPEVKFNSEPLKDQSKAAQSPVK